MVWICPECSHENDDYIIRCVCGHEITNESEKIDSLSPIIDIEDRLKKPFAEALAQREYEKASSISKTNKN